MPWVSERGSQAGKNIFIVHGRDHAPMRELKAMLYEFGLNPVVLHEEASGGLTLPEKLEKYSNVCGYAFIILTPDDVGTSYSKIVEFGEKLVKTSYLSRYWDLKRRSRQNVVLELGYFMGKLGRERVCCLYRGDIELPSDMHGIVYVLFKESVNEVRDMIIKELKSAGYELNIGEMNQGENNEDLNKLKEEVEMLKRRGISPP